MRLGTIKIGEKDVSVAASGATPYNFKAVFGRDLMDFMSRLSTVWERQDALEKNTDLTVAEKDQELLDLQQRFGINDSNSNDVMAELAYTMACDAEKKVGSQKGFLKWLEEFNTMDIQEAGADIIGFYLDTATPDVNPKNPGAVPTEE